LKRRNKPAIGTAYGARRFIPRADRVYIAFNKPYAVLTQFTQPDGSEKETLSPFHFPPDVYSIGRLDYDSEGLLLLSDDAALNAALLQPSHGHTRSYLVQVENIPSEEALEKLRRGVMVEGRRTLPCDAELLPTEPELPPRPVPVRFRKNIPTAWIKLTLTEGKNRQVRKMTAAVGHPTLRLVRISIGALTLQDLHLQPGEWKELSADEITRVFT
jgi:23S rRNA pseudouridine2457 synthase